MAAPATPTLPAGGLLDRAIRRITDAWRDMAAGVAPAADACAAFVIPKALFEYYR